MKSRILVVEDDRRIAAAISRSLSYDGHTVDAVHSGDDALRRVRASVPDLIILDVMLPGVDGFEVCRRIRSAGDPVPILMLTARDEVADRVHGLDSGADDYLVKPFAHDEMLARVRALLRRAAPGAGEPVTFAGLALDPETMIVSYLGRPIDLTALEFRLLEYFMTNQRIVLSRSRLLLEVWGLDTETTSNVVDVYVGYLRQKMGPDDAGRLLQTVRGVGYVLREPA